MVAMQDFYCYRVCVCVLYVEPYSSAIPLFLRLSVPPNSSGPAKAGKKRAAESSPPPSAKKAKSPSS